MRSPIPAFRPRLRSLAAVLIVSIASGSAVAGPDEAPAGAASDKLDAISHFLQDHGLAASTAPGLQDDAGPGLFERVHDRASRMVVAAMDFIGVPYRRGGTSVDTGFDCSGFTRFVFNTSLGLALPRRADEQATAPGMVAVDRDALQPGDLVFFNTMKRTFSHVGIYIGGNRFIHAPRSGEQVRTDDMSFAYWAKRFTGARRFDPRGPVEAQKTQVSLDRAGGGHTTTEGSQTASPSEQTQKDVRLRD